jgi:hypothetical protein
LVAYWRLADTSPAKAEDAFHNHIDGQYHDNVALGADPGALVLANGQKDTFAGFEGGYVEVGWDFRLNTGDFTVEAWIKPDPGAQGTGQVVASHNVVNNKDTGYELTVIRAPDANPRLQGSVADGTGAVEVKFGMTEGPNVGQLGGPDWKHVVLTYSHVSKEALLYLNGNYVATSPQQVSLVTNAAQPLRIGAGRVRTAVTPAPPDEFFRGGLDEVAIYNVPLQEGSPTDPNTIKGHYALSGRSS